MPGGRRGGARGGPKWVAAPPERGLQLPLPAGPLGGLGGVLAQEAAGVGPKCSGVEPEGVGHSLEGGGGASCREQQPVERTPVARGILAEVTQVAGERTLREGRGQPRRFEAGKEGGDRVAALGPAPDVAHQSIRRGRCPPPYGLPDCLRAPHGARRLVRGSELPATGGQSLHPAERYPLLDENEAGRTPGVEELVGQEGGEVLQPVEAGHEDRAEGRSEAAWRPVELIGDRVEEQKRHGRLRAGDERDWVGLPHSRIAPPPQRQGGRKFRVQGRPKIAIWVYGVS